MSDHLTPEQLAHFKLLASNSMGLGIGGWQSEMKNVDLAALLAHIDAQADTISERDAALDQAMEERDHAEDYADKLAYFIAPVEVIGEHSSGNNPWQNALDGGQEPPEQCGNCGGSGESFANVHRDRIICDACNGSGFDGDQS